MKHSAALCVHRLDRIFTAIAGTSLAAMTALIVADVLMRYLLNKPIFFAHDVVELYLTPLVFFLGYGPTYYHREHLAVDVLLEKAPKRARVVSDVIGALIGVFVFGALTWVSFWRAWYSFLDSEVIASIVPWPAWASYVIVPVGSALMVCVCFLRVLAPSLNGRPETAEAQ